MPSAGSETSGWWGWHPTRSWVARQYVGRADECMHPEGHRRPQPFWEQQGPASGCEGRARSRPRHAASFTGHLAVSDDVAGLRQPTAVPLVQEVAFVLSQPCPPYALLATMRRHVVVVE